MRKFGWNAVLRRPEAETGAAPAAEGEAPAQAAAAETPGEAPAGEASASAAAGEAPAAKPADWKDKRIAKLTARLAELAAKAEPAAQSAPAPKAPLDPTADFDARVAQAVQIQEFNRQCDQVGQLGRQRYGNSEFQSAVRNLVENFVDKSDSRTVLTYNTFLQAAIDSDAGADVIFALGSDPNDLSEAERILSLPPIKMAAAVAKLAVKLENATQASASPDVSRAPKPIRPIGNNAGSAHSEISPSDPDRQSHLSTAEWMKRREAEVAKSGRRY